MITKKNLKGSKRVDSGEDFFFFLDDAVHHHQEMLDDASSTSSHLIFAKEKLGLALHH